MRKAEKTFFFLLNGFTKSEVFAIIMDSFGAEGRHTHEPHY